MGLRSVIEKSKNGGNSHRKIRANLAFSPFSRKKR
jgi:hypothetical protein